MSWKDRIENTVFTITTGDGKVFTPLWKSGETKKDFNTAVFDFINLPGSLISRKEVKARQFPLVFWFQGDDNIDQADEFDQSANDPRAWVIQHPFYGNITGQPLNIGRNDNTYNVTEITVDFWETITDQLPKAIQSIPDATATQYTEIATAAPVDYASKVDLKPTDVATVQTVADQVDAFINKTVDKINVTADVVIGDANTAYNNYQQAKSLLFTDINNLIDSPGTAIASVFALFGLPAQFPLSITIRLQLFGDLYDSIAAILSQPSPNNKAFFESAGSAVIGAMCVALVNPLPADYRTRNNIATVTQTLVKTYNQYLQALNTAYVKLSKPASSFSPSYPTQAALQKQVIATIANLNTLAFNARQQRTTILDKDSNLIVLTHKYMGLDPLDANIEAFRTLNDIKNKELFLVKKGRLIKYLV